MCATAPGASLTTDLPIGVFDSGIGGLTVLRALRQALPAEDFVYLGDTARVPYGPRSPATVRLYAQRVAGHLVRRGIKALVIACNTATTWALEALQEAGAPRGLVVIGVIQPGVEEALRQTSTGVVGVIGTEGTIRGGRYATALQAGRNDIRVVQQACPLFVSLAEEGWTEGKVAELVAERYLAPLKEGPDTIILGCTHYPLLQDVIEMALPGVHCVDSASAAARATARQLGEAGLLREDSGHQGEARFLVTDHISRFQRVGARFLGEVPSPAEVVHLDESDDAAMPLEPHADTGALVPREESP